MNKNYVILTILVLGAAAQLAWKLRRPELRAAFAPSGTRANLLARAALTVGVISLLALLYLTPRRLTGAKRELKYNAMLASIVLIFGGAISVGYTSGPPAPGPNRKAQSPDRSQDV